MFFFGVKTKTPTDVLNSKTRQKRLGRYSLEVRILIKRVKNSYLDKLTTKESRPYPSQTISYYLGALGSPRQLFRDRGEQWGAEFVGHPGVHRNVFSSAVTFPLLTYKEEDS